MGMNTFLNTGVVLIYPKHNIQFFYLPKVVYNSVPRLVRYCWSYGSCRTFRKYAPYRESSALYNSLCGQSCVANCIVGLPKERDALNET